MLTTSLRRSFGLLPCLSVGLAGCGTLFTGISDTTREVPGLLLAGEQIELRSRSADAPQNAPNRPDLLILALDGMNRDLLYDMLHAGELPGLAALLAVEEGEFPHAYFSDSYTAALPSSTAPTWVTAMTGRPPAEHGVTGNEFFIRETGELAAPVPVSVNSAAPVITALTKGYWNRLVEVPGVYEQMREREPHIRIWVSMHQYQSGADKLILSEGSILLNAFTAFMSIGQEQIDGDTETAAAAAIFREVDQEAIEGTVEALEDDVPVDVLTIYISGTDQIAHVSPAGIDAARREYMIEFLDDLFIDLCEQLERRGMLDNRYVIVTSDHGQTAVPREENHAMAMAGEGEPAALLRKAGFRPRPFLLNVAEDDDFNAVIAYQGAMAYIYLADRSHCPEAGMVCDWQSPPRYEADVLTLADRLWRNNRTGEDVPEMQDTLDMILTRKPRPAPEDDEPFSVYIGNGETQSLAAYLEENPRPEFIDFESRIKDLSEGRYGERAGDILLIARNSDSLPILERYYFGPGYYSWHGSASASDSDIPLIVAHPGHTTTDLSRRIESVLGKRAAQQRFTDVIMELRYGK